MLSPQLQRKYQATLVLSSILAAVCLAVRWSHPSFSSEISAAAAHVSYLPQMHLGAWVILAVSLGLVVSAWELFPEAVEGSGAAIHGGVGVLRAADWSMLVAFLLVLLGYTMELAGAGASATELFFKAFFLPLVAWQIVPKLTGLADEAAVRDDQKSAYLVCVRALVPIVLISLMQGEYLLAGFVGLLYGAYRATFAAFVTMQLAWRIHEISINEAKRHGFVIGDDGYLVRPLSIQHIAAQQPVSKE